MNKHNTMRIKTDIAKNKMKINTKNTKNTKFFVTFYFFVIFVYLVFNLLQYHTILGG